MTILVLCMGAAAFGVLCLIRPQVLLKRRYENKKIPAQDIRFFRFFGAVLIGLCLLGFVVH